MPVDKKYGSLLVYLDQKVELERLLRGGFTEVLGGECGFVRVYHPLRQPLRCFCSH